MVDYFALCLIIGVASFTLTYLIRYTDGPGNIFLKFKAFLGIYEPVYMEDSDEVVDYLELVEPPDRFFAKLVACFWCCTTWISLFMTILAYILLDVTFYGLFPFAWLFAVGISGILNELLQ